MILDPHREGCVVWFGIYVTHLRGDPQTVCNDIWERVTRPIENNGEIKYEQIYEIGIDIKGIGIIYKDYLNKLGLKTVDIKSKEVSLVLPRLRGVKAIWKDR